MFDLFFNLQTIVDTACAGSTIWLLPTAPQHDEENPMLNLADVKIRRPCLCITTFPSVFAVLPPNLRGFLVQGGGQSLSVGATGFGGGQCASANRNEFDVNMKEEEVRWMRRHVQLHAVSVRAAHVFFSCIRFTSIPLIESAAASSPPALRISNGGCGVVLIDCEAAAPKSAAIVCHVRQRFNDNYRAETPAYFSDPRSAPGTPAFRSNSFNKGSSTPVFTRTGTPTSDGGSPSHEGEAGLLDVLTLVAWRCKVRESAQGFGCVRARCMLLQSTVKLCVHSACEAHGHGAQLQLLRCTFEQCSDSMLICNAGAWMRVTSSFFHRCVTVARCVDRGSLVISSCALENVSHNAVLVTQESSFFCSSCSFKDVGLE